MKSSSRFVVVLRSATLLALAACSTAAAWAQATNAPRYVFRCTTAHGRTVTSDRLISECTDREQRVYSTGGSLVRVVAPSMTADERTAAEEKRAREREIQDALAENRRRDRQLALRFPNEKAHVRAREQSLESVETASGVIETRLKLLAEDRGPLDREAEFYVGKSLPVKLKQQYDSIEATEAGLRTALQAQADEAARINEMYDIELERLKKLWAGAAAGTLGPLRSPSTTAAKSHASKTVTTPKSVESSPPDTKPAESTRVESKPGESVPRVQDNKTENRPKRGGGSGGGSSGNPVSPT